jgi:Immunity protein 50
MGSYDKIINIHLLTDIFGEFPSFHDSEVLRIVLDRRDFRIDKRPTLAATIHLWKMTSEINKNGCYILSNHTLVTFEFEDIQDLEITDFNIQNVLGCLVISELLDQHSKRTVFEVAFDGIYGVDARFRCRSIRVVEAVPYNN